MLKTTVILVSCLISGAQSALIPSTALKVPQPSVCGLQKLFCYNADHTAKWENIEAAIDYVCSQWDAYQFPKSDGKEGITESYASPDNQTIASMMVRKTGSYNSLCGYKLLKETCKYWLSKPATQCPAQHGGNVTDLWCGLQWVIEPGDTFEGLDNGALQEIKCSTTGSASGKASLSTF
ncbi:hypothetical protein DOTSEDRAFT_21824 [Dothistroma septosporum NZE10]|uniref:Ecp2 effector protein domain-containing protein n=1 Tax=Dothistroma septosporum (strain NZE10 / CBS 128990) TaxID=675120 RepID=N1PX81_DOTSN|nr:hypothetical protein DOTSEDRAFT_21824 [Dothistroma septosporum NZE10]